MTKAEMVKAVAEAARITHQVADKVITATFGPCRLVAKTIQLFGLPDAERIHTQLMPGGIFQA